MSVTQTPEVEGRVSGWAALFWQAFTRSKNPMVLLDDERRHVEVNGAYLSLLGYKRDELVGRPVYELVSGGPLVTTGEWRTLLLREHFTGTADLVCADGGLVTMEFAGHPEMVTGRRLVLFVAMKAGRTGRRVPGAAPPRPEWAALSRRELDVIRLLALGYTGPEAARELQLAHNTVRTHVRNAMAKMGAHSRAQLVARTLGEGIYWREGAP